MKDFLGGITVLIVLVAVLVAGYYLGLFMALVTAGITGIALLLVIIALFGLFIWELLFPSKPDNDQAE